MKIMTGVTAAVLLVTSQASFGSIILNGSFETGDFTDWTASGNIKVTAFGGGAAVPSDGVYGVSLNSGDVSPNGVLFQSFAAEIGTTYLLEFDFAKGGNGSGTASLGLTVEGTGFLLNETINDSTGGSPGAYSHYSFPFTADSTSLVLTFADSTSGSGIAFDGALDNVSIQAIPEPAGAALMGLASGFIFFLRRRFRS